MKRSWFYFTLLLSIVCSWVIYQYGYKHAFLFEIVLGWTIALIHFGASILIKVQAGKRLNQDGVIFVMKWNILKVAILITILIGIIFKGMVELAPFLLSFFVAYWAWIIYEVLALHFNSLGNNKSHEPTS